MTFGYTERYTAYIAINLICVQLYIPVNRCVQYNREPNFHLRFLRMDPSMSCGPFRLEDKMYDVIPAMIDSLPGFFKGILNFVTSAAFATAVFVCLV